MHQIDIGNGGLNALEVFDTESIGLAPHRDAVLLVLLLADQFDWRFGALKDDVAAAQPGDRFAGLCEAPSPTASIAMTEPTPKTMPSMVSSERTL